MSVQRSMCSLVYDHTSACMCVLVPAIKNLEQNQNGKLHLEITHNLNFSSGYRTIRSAVLWVSTVLPSAVWGTVAAKYVRAWATSQKEEKWWRRMERARLGGGSTRKDWVFSVCAIAWRPSPPSPYPWPRPSNPSLYWLSYPSSKIIRPTFINIELNKYINECIIPCHMQHMFAWWTVYHPVRFEAHREEYYLLECDTVQSGRRSPTFQRNELPPSSCSKSKTIKQ
jgi:hypothetical protein